MVLKELIFNILYFGSGVMVISTTLGGCGGPERNHF